MSKCSIDWDMPPKGVILTDFIRIFAILCFVSMENLFVFFIATLRQIFFDTAKFIVILVVLEFKRFY